MPKWGFLSHGLSSVLRFIYYSGSWLNGQPKKFVSQVSQAAFRQILQALDYAYILKLLPKHSDDAKYLPILNRFLVTLFHLDFAKRFLTLLTIPFFLFDRY